MRSPVQQLRRTFVVGLSLLIGTMLAGTAFALWRLHIEAVANGLETAAMHTRSVESFVTQNLNDTELVAATVAISSEVFNRPDVERIMSKTLRHAPFLRSMSVVDDSGRIVASSNPANVGLQVSTQNFLPPHAANNEILRIGPPWLGRDFADGKPSTLQAPVGRDAANFIPIVRTLVRGEQTLTLLIALNPDYFLNHVSQSLDAADGSVEVLRFDGTLLIDTDPLASPGSFHGYVVHDLGLPDIESGKFEGLEAGERPVFTAFRASSLYPFVVVTHIDRELAMQAWRTEAKTMLGVVIPTLILIYVLARVFYRRQAHSNRLLANAAQVQSISATVFDSSAAAIMITDTEANIVSVNTAFTQVTGYTADEVIGKNPRMWQGGRQDQDFYAQMWRQLRQQGRWAGDVVNRRKDGTLHHVHLSITASHNPQGVVDHYIGISTDISDQVRATEAAQQANQAKSRFLATMSHEIRTPMNGILGMAQLLLMPQATAGDRDDYARTILTSGQSLLALLNDILDLSRIESGKLELEATVFEPEQLLIEAQALFSGSAKTKGLEMMHAWHGVPGQRYEADAHRLRQMLVNLVGNALKFTSHGSIQLEARAIEADPQGHTALEFSVRDTGIGIAADKLKLLFQPFSQTDSSTTREFGGSGLGLSIVSSLAQLAGGDVGVESEPGVGSRFWFRIQATPVGPVENTHPATPAAPVPPVPATPAQLIGRVLVAEDHAINRMVIKSLLTRMGLHITMVEDGALAVQAIVQGDTPDLILMDLNMPEMDGYTATEKIRQWEADTGQPRLPIIALTADAFAEDHQHCLAVGMDDFLTKPVTMEALQAALGRHLHAAPATTTPTPTAAPALRALDPVQWNALVAEIIPLLERNQFDALARMKALKTLAEGSPLHTEVSEIDALVREFKFDAALSRLRATVAPHPLPV